MRAASGDVSLVMWCHIFKERWHLVKKNPLCTTYFEVSVHLSVHQFVSPSICLCWWLIPCSSPLKLLPFLPLFLLYRCWINVCDINMAAIQNLMKLVLNATSVRHQCEIRESSRHSLKGQLSRLSNSCELSERPERFASYLSESSNICLIFLLFRPFFEAWPMW